MADIDRGEPPAMDLIIRIHEDGNLTPQMRNYGADVSASSNIVALGVLVAHFVAAILKEPANEHLMDEYEPSEWLDYVIENVSTVAEEAFWDELPLVDLRDRHDPAEALTSGAGASDD